MKRFIFLFAALTVILCGCTALYRFPEGAVIGGVDVAGLNLEAAAEKLEALPEAYTLTVTLDGETTVLTGADLFMTCHLPENLRSAIGTKAEDIYEITLPPDILSRLRGVDISRKDGMEKARLVFDPTSQSYTTQTGKDWTWNDYSPAVQALSAAARELKSEVTVAPEKITVSGEKDPLPGAATANTWLGTVLTISFPDGEEKVDRTNILEWVSVDADGVTPVLDESTIGAYATNMAQAHSVAASDARVFVTTSGKSIYLQNAYGGYSVNAESLAKALYSGILAGGQTTIEAEILPGEPGRTVVDNFGGDYVEVDIPNQTVYCYRNGALVLQTACVTGCLANGDGTPTGVYSFYDLDRDVWLTGPTWNDWVDCWMGFYGSYGLHDANWRTEFGGDIYVNDGSHGCVNLPPEVAPTLYGYLYYGMTIILY